MTRPLSFAFLTFAMTATSFAACGTTPGRVITVMLRARADGSPSFTTATGWDVTVTEARLVLGPVYILAPRTTALLQLFQMPVALAHGGADEYATLGIRAEWLDQISLDMLATEPTILGEGNGVAGAIGDAEVDIDPPGTAISSATHGHQAWLVGTASMGATMIPFEGGLDIADLTIARRVQGIPCSGDVDDGSELTVGVHLHSWLDRMDFDRLPAPSSGAVREIVPGTQPYNAWLLGARTSTAFAITNGSAP